MRRFTAILCSAFVSVTVCAEADHQSGSDLRLVPFPKAARIAAGEFRIPRRAVLLVDGSSAVVVSGIRDDLAAAVGSACIVEAHEAVPGRWRVALAVSTNAARRLLAPSAPAQPEGYALRVTPAGAVVAAGSKAGLEHGTATLRQLIRANLHGRAIPCLEVRDWPSLRYRGFLDDITRGPSPTLAQLEREADLAAYLRMNFLTYYLESQFAFHKHPEIGPKDGSLTPEDLTSLVRHASPRGLEIIGCQQSFGHFGSILRLPQFAGLRETPDVLDPTNEGTYRLLDDLYSEQSPLLPSKLFLVCCDETYGLGTGPSKELVDRIGVGGVYARHLARVHDLITGKYGKRMMMWGDIILQHPDHLREIPTDTVMLSWGYSAAPSFDQAILPFKRAGFEFMVCPGVNNWSRILPEFSTATTNIRNYVRDGARYGAMGMLNTTWDDDGETLFGPNWYGLAWGAECAWNASTTSRKDFDRRTGAVLFGEQGDHFGRAIALLSRSHALPGYQGMMDARFWQADDGRLPVSREAAVAQARTLLAIVDPAIVDLKEARREARFNRQVLDTYLFGAARMRFLATRELDILAAADAYDAALVSPPSAAAGIQRAAKSIRRSRDTLASLRTDYVRLWRSENRPYSLSNVLARYDAAVAGYDRILAGLAKAQTAAAAGMPLPSAESVGLGVVELGARRLTPSAVLAQPYRPDSAWACPAQPRRLGIIASAGSVDRLDQPVELELPVPVSPGAQLMEVSVDGKTQTPAPSQIVRGNGRSRLLFIAAGRIAAGSRRTYLLYYGLATQGKNAGGVSVSRAANGYWVDNGRIRLLIGSEGAHIYRWEVKELGGRDLTQPGERDWEGFADINGANRNAPNRIEVLESGPMRARLRCTDTTGLVKTFDIWAGAPWVECTLNAASGWFACYDDIALMGAGTSTPGRFLFENGDAGPVHPFSSGLECQERRDGQRWCAKYVTGGPMIALLTPETACRHVVGPGAGMGAVFIEGPPEASHFVIYGGKAPESPRAALDSLRAAADFGAPPALTRYGVQERPGL